MTDRHRPGRGWDEYEIESQPTLESDGPPDPGFDRVDTLVTHGRRSAVRDDDRDVVAYHAGGEHRESYPEMPPSPVRDIHPSDMPKPDLRTPIPPKPRAVYTIEQLEQLFGAAAALQQAQVSLLSQSVTDARLSAVDKRFEDQQQAMADGFVGLDEKLRVRDDIAARTRQMDREEQAARDAKVLADIKARTPGRFLIWAVVLMIAGIGAGGLVFVNRASSALQDMARDVRKQQQQRDE